MPLFEFDESQLEGRVATPANDGAPSQGHHDAAAARLAQVIDDNLDGLIGEQVFPVARSLSPSEPYLIALDPSGAPVVVELVGTLDNAALIRILDHAGAAGRMTRGQLAGRYPGGTQLFLADLARFMDSVPVKRARMPRSGSRLIIICQQADQAVLNAVDFLRQPAMPIEVLRLGLVSGTDGRRFLDLSPLVINPDSAPDRPRLVGAPAGPTMSPLPQVPRIAAVPSAVGPTPERSRTASRQITPERRAQIAATLAAAQQAVSRAEAVIALGVHEVPDDPVAESPVARPVLPSGRPASIGSESEGEPSVRSPQSLSETTATTTATPPALETRRQRRERLAVERAAEAARRAAAPGPADAAPADHAASELELSRRQFAARLAAEQADVGAVGFHLPTGLETGEPLPAVLHAHALPAGLTVDGVLSAGTEASDPLSWDTARLPVVVDPIRTGAIPVVRPADAVAQADPATGTAPTATTASTSSTASAAPAAVRAQPAAPTTTATAPVRRTSVVDAVRSGSRHALHRPPAPPAVAPAAATGALSAPAAPPTPAALPDYQAAITGEPIPVIQQGDPTPQVAGAFAGPGTATDHEGRDDEIDDRPDPVLIDLAGRLGEPTALVWERPRRHQRFAATLDQFGTIHLGGGGDYHNPDAAARAVSGSHVADGWTLWRIESPDGPTLLDVLTTNDPTAD